jgi:sortase A
MRPDENTSRTPTPQHQQAASNIVRQQIESVYDQSTPQIETEPPTQATVEQARQQQHQTTAHHTLTPEQWKQYHSAWQEYYQKYYERYYVGHIHQARQAMAAQLQTPTPAQDETISEDEALNDLRATLRNKIQERATKIRKSRHFVPITAAVCVMLVFAFLQYNQLLIANVKAYISPGAIDPQNIIVDPTTSTTVDPSLTNIIIPKINVDAPVNYDVTTDYNQQMEAMRNGLAYFGIPGANSKPGQVGNTPVAGHSSNDVFETGNYKFIFAQLEKMTEGDIIYANYQGTRYTYKVVKTEVVLPSEVNRLVYPTDRPLLTLITCTPLGTAQKRLLVTAEQVNPSPASSQPAPAPSTAGSANATLPGTEPTLIERLFGRR